jgi:hypothetical protein
MLAERENKERLAALPEDMVYLRSEEDWKEE